jgi:hypothetical protein
LVVFVRGRLSRRRRGKKWRHYDPDAPGIAGAIRHRNLYRAVKESVIFGGVWGLWHMPLFLIPDTYHYNILQQNPWFTFRPTVRHPAGEPRLDGDEVKV